MHRHYSLRSRLRRSRRLWMDCRPTGNWKSHQQLFYSPSLGEADTSTNRGKEAGYFFNSAGQF
jgi:hypothetical protein